MLEFYRNRKVFITGHTGFKGSWLSKILLMAGANICGFSKSPHTTPNLFDILQLENKMTSIIGDIRNFNEVKKAINDFQPDIIFHLAAQPLVRESYNNPVETFETNVMGTVNLLEAVRACKCVRSVVNVTTDKVYENKEWEWGYRENEPLNGFDPYSNSKSCSELVTSSYKKSFFFNELSLAISTARAGNVIGGGDFSIDRILPDCIRAAINNEEIIVRNPYSIRPYQHVFEALSAYIILAERQFNDKSVEGCYNIGPKEEGCVTTSKIADIFCEAWGNIKWINKHEVNPNHEANFLKLDCSKIRNSIGWAPKIDINQAIQLTVDWTKLYYNNEDMEKTSENQIISYFGG